MNGPANANRHLSLLALTMLGLGAVSVIGGAALAVVGIAGGGALAFSGDVGSGAGVAALMMFSGLAIALTGVPEIACWVGLTKRRPWGRTLALFLCAMSLAAFPLGTAFGAWGLYLLLSTNGVKAFGIERTLGTDAAAVALGWMFRPSRDDGLNGGFDDRRDRRGHRRGHRARRSGGCGCLTLVLLLAGLAMFTTCGHAFTSCAGALTGDATRYDSVSPMKKARDIVDGMSVDQTTAPAPAPAPTPIPDPVQVHERVTVPVPVVPDAAHTAPAIGADAPKKSFFIYTDKGGTPVIVDDINKVPDDRKHTLRAP